MSGITITSGERDGVTIVALSGDAGITNVDAIEREFTRLIAAHPMRLIMDLSQLAFIASLAIGQLIGLGRNVVKRGGAAAIAAPTPAVRDVLSRCNVHGLVPIADTFEDALSRVSMPA